MLQSLQKKKINLPSTQKYLEIVEIREGVLIMKDGSLRVALLASSVNFALKSQEEQEAIISSYVSFLNYLDFPLQIVIQSRKLNIDHYLAEIKARENKQSNELLRMQTAEYIQYVKELVELGDIMSKRFYIIIPWNPGGETQEKFLVRLSQLFSPLSSIRLNDEKFLEYKNKIQKRIDKIVSGLQGMGISAVQLDTQGLIELFYNTYNLEISESQKLGGVEEMQVE